MFRVLFGRVIFDDNPKNGKEQELCCRDIMVYENRNCNGYSLGTETNWAKSITVAG